MAEAEAETIARVRLRLEESLPQRDTILVAEQEGIILGYAAVRWFPGLILPGPDAYLSELFLLPDSTGHGIGSQLLTHLRAEARERKATRLWCINFKARPSYQRSYYRKSGWDEQDIAVFFTKL